MSTVLAKYRSMVAQNRASQPLAATAAVTGAHLAPHRPAPQHQGLIQPVGPGGFVHQAGVLPPPQYAQPYPQQQQGGFRPQAAQAPGQMPLPQAMAGFSYFQGQPIAPAVPQGYAPQGYAPQGYAPQGYAPQGYGAPGFQQQAAYAAAPQGYAPQYGYAPQGAGAPWEVQARAAAAGVQVQPLQHFASNVQEGLYEPGGAYNPQAYGGSAWVDGLQRAVPNPTARLFNASGQINANDRRDALVQIKHFLDTSARHAGLIRTQRSNESQAERMEKARTLCAAVRDTEGFAVLGQQLLLPIKSIIDYEGWARKVFRVRSLQQGEYFRMAKDVRATAWVIGQDGQGVESRLYGRYVTPSEFKIGSFPTIDVEEIYQMNFDVLDRAQQTARQEIELEEDKRARALIDTAARTVNSVVSFTSLGIGAFEDIRYQVERHRLQVAKFLINRAELSDIVQTMSTQVDPVSERELILAGYIGSVLNAVIMTTAGTGVEEVVPAGTVYAVTDSDYLGEMGIRLELFSEPFTMFAQRKLARGYAFGEIIGFVLPEPRACAVGVK